MSPRAAPAFIVPSALEVEATAEREAAGNFAATRLTLSRMAGNPTQAAMPRQDRRPEGARRLIERPMRITRLLWQYWKRAAAGDVALLRTLPTPPSVSEPDQAHRALQLQQ